MKNSLPALSHKKKKRTLPSPTPKLHLLGTPLERTKHLENPQSNSQCIPFLPISPNQQMQQFMAKELGQLETTELLALIIRTHSSKAGSAFSQAQKLSQKYATLRCLEQAGINELCETPGITPAKATALQAALALGRRLLSHNLERGCSFECSYQIYKAFHPKLKDLEYESFWVLLLDQKNRIIKQLQIIKGSIHQCQIHPSDVLTPAVREKSLRMVLLHNHPTGSSQPSAKDRHLTKKLQEAANLLGIEILDHIIIGSSDYFSFADKGWLTSKKSE